MPRNPCRPRLLGALASVVALPLIPVPVAELHPCLPSHCSPIVAITDVNVLTMLSPDVLPGQTVIVRQRRVAEIGPARSVRIPADAIVVKGRGGYLMPGLIDAHVHIRDRELDAYVSNGVLTVRNMWGYPRLRSIKWDIKAGKLIGPTIYSLSPGLDAAPGHWPLTQFVNDPRQADSVVAVQDGEGWKVIKIYQELSLASFDSIATAVRRRGLRFAGHVPTAVSVEHALESGMYSIEHLTGYDQAVSRNRARNAWGWAQADVTLYKKLAIRTAEARVWNCPTLAIQASFARDRSAAERDAAIANMRKFAWTLYKVGAPLVTGTDAGIDRVAAGTSMLDELREFEAAGIPRYQALRAATVSGGMLLNQPLLGTIAVGAPAELILLRENPFDDLDALRTLEGVLLQGTWRPMPLVAPAPSVADVPGSTNSPARPHPAGLRAPKAP